MPLVLFLFPSFLPFLKNQGQNWHNDVLESGKTDPRGGGKTPGLDNCYINNREALGPYDWRTQRPVTTLSSDWSGIQLDVYTNQDAFQMYSCGGQNGTVALKKTQGVEGDNKDKFPRTIPKYGCLVLEVQDYIDGINHPEWMRGRKQIFEPGGDPYVLQAKYRFSLKGGDKKDASSS